MSDQGVRQREEAEMLTRRKVAMVVSVLLFLAIYLWGFVSGLIALSESKAQE